MTKQYPSKQYLSEVISNREFAESVPPEIVIVMARQLLASMVQEPVYQVLGDGSWTDYSKQQLEDLLESKPSTLFRVAYAAPQLPQPAVMTPDYSQFLSDVMTAAGLLSHGKRDKALANSLSEFCVAERMRMDAPCRAAPLEGAEPVSQPNTLRDGYCIMPMKLTAENGAKGALSGEFSETKFINCPECFGDDECETCDGSGRIEISVPVSWTTIKEIWAKGVEHFAAAPKQEVK